MKPVIPETVRLSRERQARREEVAKLKPGWLCPKCGSAHGPHVETCPEGRVIRDIIR